MHGIPYFLCAGALPHDQSEIDDKDQSSGRGVREAGALPRAIYLGGHWEMMEAFQLDLLRTDELDIALRLSYLEHSGGAAGAGSADDKEARRKEKKKQKDLKVGKNARSLLSLVLWCPARCTSSWALERPQLLPAKCAVRLA